MKGDVLLICPRKIVEDIEQRLNVQLREYARIAQNRMGGLRIVCWRLIWMSRNVVFRSYAKSVLCKELLENNLL